jgi:hypothetical protein
LKESQNRPEVKAKMSQSAKEAQNRPEVKAKHREAIKEALANPDVKAKMSQATKEALSRPEVKAKRSQALKESQNRPEVKAKISQASKEAHARPEVKAKLSQSVKEACARPEIKAKKSQYMREAQAKKELVNPSTGETKEVHWREMLPFLKDGWELTFKVITLFNPKDNNRRTTVTFERPNRKVDKDKAHARLIQLLEDGWEVGCHPKDFNGIKSGGEEIVGVQEEKVEENGEKGEYCERRRMWSLF